MVFLTGHASVSSDSAMSLKSYDSGFPDLYGQWLTAVLLSVLCLSWICAYNQLLLDMFIVCKVVFAVGLYYVW